jgi:hypothetical protein
MKIKGLLITAVAAAALYGCGGHEIEQRENARIPSGARFAQEADTARYADGELAMEATYLPPGKVDLYFSRFKGGEYKNPFPPVSFMVFSVEIKNTGKGPVSFNPRATLIALEGADPVSPRDFASMYSTLSFAKAGDIDRRMEAFRAACFDTAVTAVPGDVVRRLLVFPRPKEHGKGGIFMFNGLYVEGEGRAVKLPYIFQE